MTTTTHTPAAPAEDAPSPLWHATVVAAPETPAPADDAALRVATRIGFAGTWLLAFAILAGLIRAATGTAPYRGGLSVLGIALAATVLWGIAERIASRVLSTDDDPDDGEA